MFLHQKKEKKYSDTPLCVYENIIRVLISFLVHPCEYSEVQKKKVLFLRLKIAIPCLVRQEAIYFINYKHKGDNYNTVCPSVHITKVNTRFIIPNVV
jgi:hypothetical protein